MSIKQHRVAHERPLYWRPFRQELLDAQGFCGRCGDLIYYVTLGGYGEAKDGTLYNLCRRCVDEINTSKTKGK